VSDRVWGGGALATGVGGMLTEGRREEGGGDGGLAGRGGGMGWGGVGRGAAGRVGGRG
jgi:hypothetical protein